MDQGTAGWFKKLFGSLVGNGILFESVLKQFPSQVPTMDSTKDGIRPSPLKTIVISGDVECLLSCTP